MEEAVVPDMSSMATKNWTIGFGNVESILGTLKNYVSGVAGKKPGRSGFRREWALVSCRTRARAALWGLFTLQDGKSNGMVAGGGRGDLGGGIKSCIYADGNDPGERGNRRCGKGVDMYWTDILK